MAAEQTLAASRIQTSVLKVVHDLKDCDVGTKTLSLVTCVRMHPRVDNRTVALAISYRLSLPSMLSEKKRYVNESIAEIGRCLS